MIKLIGTVVGVFFLFMLGFPLAGFLVAVGLKVFLPYLLIPAMLAPLLAHSLALGNALEAFLYLGAGWVILLQLARWLMKRRDPSLLWHDGHYRAALLVLSLGLPYWTGKKPVEVDAEQIQSVAESA